MSNPLSPETAIYDALYPKAAANYLSKLPEMGAVPYFEILGTLSVEGAPLTERLYELANRVGASVVSDTSIKELDILRYSMVGEEDAIEDAGRKEFYKRVDANQTVHSQDPRNLQHFLQSGVIIETRPGSPSILRTADDCDPRPVPLLEKSKSEKVFSINGYMNSKVLHALHDVMDHPWLFSHLAGTGIFSKYEDFLASIGVSEEGYLYSRQAELVAGIGFGSRRWQYAKDTNERVLLDSGLVMDILADSEDERCQDVHMRYTRLDQSDQQWGIFVLENAIIQTSDERRRFGAVKQLAPDQSRKPMSLLDPVYIAFVLDSVIALQECEDYDALQIATSLSLQNTLTRILVDASADSIYTLRIPDYNAKDSSVDPIDRKWIIQNYPRLTSYNKEPA